MRIEPDYALAHYSLGNALASQGKISEAIAHYSEALRIEPEFALVHYNLGLVLVQQGKIEEAARHFETALQLNPNYQDVRRALDDLTIRSKSSGSATQ